MAVSTVSTESSLEARVTLPVQAPTAARSTERLSLARTRSSARTNRTAIRNLAQEFQEVTMTQETMLAAVTMLSTKSKEMMTKALDQA